MSGRDKSFRAKGLIQDDNAAHHRAFPPRRFLCQVFNPHKLSRLPLLSYFETHPHVKMLRRHGTPVG